MPILFRPSQHPTRTSGSGVFPDIELVIVVTAGACDCEAAREGVALWVGYGECIEVTFKARNILILSNVEILW